MSNEVPAIQDEAGFIAALRHCAIAANEPNTVRVLDRIRDLPPRIQIVAGMAVCEASNSGYLPVVHALASLSANLSPAPPRRVSAPCRHGAIARHCQECQANQYSVWLDGILQILEHLQTGTCKSSSDVAKELRDLLEKAAL